MTPRLADATSAYLRSAAHQPVDWHPWGPDAFARARAEDKPILLDIGAVWCHWCHVMDRESYENAELATYLNDVWVCIKVDRDERPDVDARYQRMVQAMSGQGGWPLTGFLTPDGQVFFGGTYFPPDGAHGRPGFRTILSELERLWRDERPRLLEQATVLRDRIAELEDERIAAGPVTPALIEQAADGLARVFDFRYGGFGNQPKFPHPGALRFLLVRWRDGTQAWPRELVDRTLMAMADGGIHDQVGGGFHRYSVDAKWVVPHFEKMLYDNAELLSAYCDALASTDEQPRYRATIAGIVRFTLQELADDAGGYAASQDADVTLDDDGDYFTWTVEEIRAACDDPAVADAMLRHFGVSARGHMHHDPSRNVLHVRDAIDDDLRQRGLAALRATRAQRQAPFIDRTIYVGWSALMASALLKAGAILDDPRSTHHALRTLARLASEGLDESGGARHAIGGPGGLLEDQAYLAQALLDAFEHTGERSWLDRARALIDHTVAAYRDPNGLFRDRAGGTSEGLLEDPIYPIHDAPAPAPNGAMAEVLLRLAAHTGHEPYRETARALLAAAGETLADLGVHGAALLLAADRLVNPATHVVVVADDDAGQAVWQAARAAWAPRRVLTRRRPGDDPSGLPDPVQAMLTGDHPRAYVCVGTACRAPAATPDELREALQG